MFLEIKNMLDEDPSILFGKITKSRARGLQTFVLNMFLMIFYHFYLQHQKYTALDLWQAIKINQVIKIVF